MLLSIYGFLDLSLNHENRLTAKHRELIVSKNAQNYASKVIFRSTIAQKSLENTLAVKFHVRVN